MSEIALSNAVSATLTNNAFFKALGRAVANDGSPDTAAAWLWTLLDDGRGIITTYDTYITVVERLVLAFPVICQACEMLGMDPVPISRFVAERIPAAMKDTVSVDWYKPVTKTLVLAERAHDLAAMFKVGNRPTGSKDPYAVRRLAKHFIIAAVTLPPPSL